MKTLDELSAEIRGSKELQEKLVSAAKSGELERFFKEQDCEAAFSDIKRKMSEISDDELEQVNGGSWYNDVSSVGMDYFSESMKTWLVCYFGVSPDNYD